MPFARHAEAYRRGAAHARGRSLQLAVELLTIGPAYQEGGRAGDGQGVGRLGPQPDWEFELPRVILLAPAEAPKTGGPVRARANGPAPAGPARRREAGASGSGGAP